jgi:hypothetical protein
MRSIDFYSFHPKFLFKAIVIVEKFMNICGSIQVFFIPNIKKTNLHIN